MQRGLLTLTTGAVLALMTMTTAGAGIVVYEKGDKKLEIGGRLQVQYLNFETSGAAGGDENFDRIFFRRLRPYIAGTATKHWYGKIQFDFGAAEDANEVSVKDAYMRYSRLKNHTFTIGNSKTPYSREYLTSSKYQQHIERTFGGSHNFASPDRQLGIRFEGKQFDSKFVYNISVGAEDHDPAVNRMDFDTPVNSQSDWNQGGLVAARVDWHPLGYVKFSQGDFHTDKWLFTVSLAGYYWENDDDNNTYTDPNTGVGIDLEKADLAKANGIEVSAGVRGHGASIDVEYQMVSGDTVGTGFTGGLYLNGSTDIDLFAIEGGYMLPGNHVELVAAWDTIDATNYQDTWRRSRVGVNWFWNEHKAKIQLTYRKSKNYLGEAGVEADAISTQVQFFF